MFSVMSVWLFLFVCLTVNIITFEKPDVYIKLFACWSTLIISTLNLKIKTTGKNSGHSDG